MPKFKLKETTLDIRGSKVRVRELTQSERHKFFKEVSDDKFRAPAVLVSLGLVEPKMTEEEVADEPGDVIQILTDAIMNLSGMKSEKEPDARGAVSMPAISGDGTASKPN